MGANALKTWGLTLAVASSTGCGVRDYVVEEQVEEEHEEHEEDDENEDEVDTSDTEEEEPSFESTETGAEDGDTTQGTHEGEEEAGTEVDDGDGEGEHVDGETEDCTRRPCSESTTGSTTEASSGDVSTSE